MYLADATSHQKKVEKGLYVQIVVVLKEKAERKPSGGLIDMEAKQNGRKKNS